MGSAQSSEGVVPEQAVHDLHREEQILQERSMCGCGMQSTTTPQQRTEEERDASIICHVHHALRHYNAVNKGMDFVPVKPLMAAYVGFRGHIWVHVSFTARKTKITSDLDELQGARRLHVSVTARKTKITSSKQRQNKAHDPVKHFFAELRYDHHLSTPTVETCTIIDASSRHTHLNNACAFCPKSFEIFHPLDGNFACGKKSQVTEEQGFSHFMNLLEKPFTCPAASGEAKEDVATPEEKRSIIMNWTLLRPFDFCRSFITGFLWAFDATLKKRITLGATQEVKCNEFM